MADDYNEDDPLSSGESDQAVAEPEQSSKDETEYPGPPRAQVYKYPTGEPGSAYYEEQLHKYQKESDAAQAGFLKDITPYRDHILELLKQPLPKAPEQIGPGTQMSPQSIQAVLATSLPYLAIGSKHMRDIFGAIVGGSVAPMRAWSLKGKREEMEMAHEAENWVRDYNDTRMSQYKSVLADRDLQLEQQMQIMKVVAQQHQDVMMLDAIKKRDLPGIIKQLENQEMVEGKRRKAQDKLELDRQKQWLSNKDNMEYATRVANATDGKIDLTKPDAEDFRKNLRAANKVIPYEQHLEDTKAKLPEKQVGAGESTHRYETQRQEEQQKTDPLGLKSNTPATEDERKKFQDEIDSAIKPGGKSDKKKTGGATASPPPESHADKNLKAQEQSGFGTSGINVPPLDTNQPDNPLLYGQ